jgi:hypothetical protein
VKPADAPNVARVFGEHYEIEAPIGRGGMGSVFRVTDRRDGKTYALKILARLRGGQVDAQAVRARGGGPAADRAGRGAEDPLGRASGEPSEYDTDMTATIESTQLSREVAYFDAHRDELLNEAAGKYALVKGDSLAGTYESEIDAIRAGYERFGNDAFLVKQIVPVDIPLNFTSFHIGV